jgi:penicillin-binding protein 2
VWTQPTLLHQPDRTPQRTAPIGLSREQHDALFHGMELVTGPRGTARILQSGLQGLPALSGLRIAAKTGTAQKYSPTGMINFAWLIAFAPVENPQIALAIAIEGDTPGEETGGGRYAAPVAHAILRTWMEKKDPAAKPVKLISE